MYGWAAPCVYLMRVIVNVCCTYERMHLLVKIWETALFDLSLEIRVFHLNGIKTAHIHRVTCSLSKVKDNY